MNYNNISFGTFDSNLLGTFAPLNSTSISNAAHIHPKDPFTSDSHQRRVCINNNNNSMCHNNNTNHSDPFAVPSRLHSGNRVNAPIHPSDPFASFAHNHQDKSTIRFGNFFGASELFSSGSDQMDIDSEILFNNGTKPFAPFASSFKSPSGYNFTNGFTAPIQLSDPFSSSSQHQPPSKRNIGNFGQSLQPNDPFASDSNQSTHQYSQTNFNNWNAPIQTRNQPFRAPQHFAVQNNDQFPNQPLDPFAPSQQQTYIKCSDSQQQFARDLPSPRSQLFLKDVPRGFFDKTTIINHFQRKSFPPIQVKSVSLRGNNNKQSRKSAIIEFHSEVDASSAMKFDHFNGLKLHLSIFKTALERAGDPTNELLFNFIPKSLFSETSIRHLFNSLVPNSIVKVSSRERLTASGPKRTAIVTFNDVSNATTALKRLPLYKGQKLVVSFRQKPVHLSQEPMLVEVCQDQIGRCKGGTFEYNNATTNSQNSNRANNNNNMRLSTYQRGPTAEYILEGARKAKEATYMPVPLPSNDSSQNVSMSSKETKNQNLSDVKDMEGITQSMCPTGEVQERMIDEDVTMRKRADLDMLLEDKYRRAASLEKIYKISEPLPRESPLRKTSPRKRLRSDGIDDDTDGSRKLKCPKVGGSMQRCVGSPVTPAIPLSIPTLPSARMKRTAPRAAGCSLKRKLNWEGMVTLSKRAPSEKALTSSPLKKRRVTLTARPWVEAAAQAPSSHLISVQQQPQPPPISHFPTQTPSSNSKPPSNVPAHTSGSPAPSTAQTLAKHPVIDSQITEKSKKNQAERAVQVKPETKSEQDKGSEKFKEVKQQEATDKILIMKFIRDIMKSIGRVEQVVVQIRLRRRMTQCLYEQEHGEILNSFANLSEAVELALQAKQHACDMDYSRHFVGKRLSTITWSLMVPHLRRASLLFDELQDFLQRAEMYLPHVKLDNVETEGRSSFHLKRMQKSDLLVEISKAMRVEKYAMSPGARKVERFDELIQVGAQLSKRDIRCWEAALFSTSGQRPGIAYRWIRRKVFGFERGDGRSNVLKVLELDSEDSRRFVRVTEQDDSVPDTANVILAYTDPTDTAYLVELKKLLEKRPKELIPPTVIIASNLRMLDLKEYLERELSGLVGAVEVIHIHEDEAANKLEKALVRSVDTIADFQSEKKQSKSMFRVAWTRPGAFIRKKYCKRTGSRGLSRMAVSQVTMMYNRVSRGGKGLRRTFKSSLEFVVEKARGILALGGIPRRRDLTSTL